MLIWALVLVGVPDSEASSAEWDLLARINHERAARGLGKVHMDTEALGAARRHALRMAQRSSLYHNSNLGNEISGWTDLGENVGANSSTAAVHRDFMGSSRHSGIILRPGFNAAGVGAVWAHGKLWVCEVFVLRQGARVYHVSSAPAPAPAPRKAAPKPKAPQPKAVAEATPAAPEPSPVPSPSPSPKVSEPAVTSTPYLVHEVAALTQASSMRSDIGGGPGGDVWVSLAIAVAAIAGASALGSVARTAPEEED